MYLIINRISFIIRFLICRVTIERYPIFSNETLNWIIGQILSIYTILWIICYIITGKIAPKFGIKSPEGKSTVYFLIYLVLIVITYGILKLLTEIGIIPN